MLPWMQAFHTDIDHVNVNLFPRIIKLSLFIDNIPDVRSRSRGAIGNFQTLLQLTSQPSQSVPNK